MKIYYAIILAAWTASWLTLAVMEVGKKSTVVEYTWSLPFAIAAFILVPAVLGFVIGRIE